MQSGFITTASGPVPANFATASTRPRADLELQDALTKVSPAAQAKAKSTATDFEAMFLNSMFSEMTSNLKGEGPFGDTPGTGVWRSMLTEQYSKNFAKAGGVGISSEVFRTLILQQAKTSEKTTEKTTGKTTSQTRTPT
jgi:Rod binding domain-containing protein